jgi:hypothetical protein
METTLLRPLMAETIMATKLLLQHRTGGTIMAIKLLLQHGTGGTTLLTSNLRRHRTIKRLSSGLGIGQGMIGGWFWKRKRNVVRREVDWLERMAMKGVWIGSGRDLRM